MSDKEKSIRVDDLNPAAKQEMGEDDIEQVKGGASADYFLKLDGIKGETISPTRDVSSGLPTGKRTFQP